jgi:hypothetical protein
MTCTASTSQVVQFTAQPRSRQNGEAAPSSRRAGTINTVAMVTGTDARR